MGHSGQGSHTVNMHELLTGDACHSLAEGDRSGCGKKTPALVKPGRPTP
jgi:hypothetical protein